MSEMPVMQQVERLLHQLTLEEQFTIVERLVQRFRRAAYQQIVSQRQPQDLYGTWRGRFPVDFDLDTALGEIRQEWEQEWMVQETRS